MKKRKLYIVGGFAFVQHPNLRGVWLRCDLSVAKAPCEYPGCGSVIGEPCKSTTSQPARLGTYHAGTHYMRRAAARNIPTPEGVVETVITVASDREQPPNRR